MERSFVIMSNKLRYISLCMHGYGSAAIHHKLFQVPKQINVHKFISGLAALFYIVMNCDFNISCVLKNGNFY
jgi:hypothetical protein